MGIKWKATDSETVANVAVEEGRANSALVDFALAGLQRCWMPECGRWSHIYHLDRIDSPNESVPESEVFYSLNVLLGMSRVAKRPDAIKMSEIFETNALRLRDLKVPIYAFGMALWAGGELNFELPPRLRLVIERYVVEEERWVGYRAQDLGMLLAGVIAQLRQGRGEWVSLARRMYRHLLQRYDSHSRLFSDGATGYRRRFATFATQTYMVLACYIFGEHFGSSAAIAVGNECTRKLISLQGPNGEWPWFFDVRRGCVLDYYEVYSVHQYGMAPAFLEFAERYGVEGARAALIKGFNWVLGENQLDLPMIVPELSLTIRSQVRRGELGTKAWRVMRSLNRAYLASTRGAEIISPMAVTLRRECRSYELGWILWSFGQRSDLPELSENPAFSAPVRRQKRGA